MDLESVKAIALPETTGTAESALIRKISIPITWLLIKTNLTPNHVTLASFVLSLLSAAFFLGGSWIHSLIAALLLNLSTVLDYVDGEIARAKSLSTSGGALLDEFTDRLGRIVVIGAITWAAYNSDASPYIWLCGFVALGGTFLVLCTGRKVSSLRQNSKTSTGVKVWRRDSKLRKFLISGDTAHMLFITVSAIFNHLFVGLILIALSSFADAALRFAINYRSFRLSDKQMNPDT